MRQAGGHVTVDSNLACRTDDYIIPFRSRAAQKRRTEPILPSRLWPRHRTRADYIHTLEGSEPIGTHASSTGRDYAAATSRVTLTGSKSLAPVAVSD